ncbi:two-component system OmpR family sensor kinase [Microbacteriaceae bacterium SG_E_30_P1]|uniref:histidine kinase n=1 Tax=Antiquaquibacter oligotrophicus TaxID=2880260 RepID=A0ABT6KQ49_9MICO|nr:ATP-binding protein [Antiquaquibacter oligotrophicus]MDH6181946.1 two-component system OmpR family sensor kinase [Antiquaquibacter oligotrophicus]UDF12384.1 HAMP domain-containing histidine kinase [Antiquaquibacter oligotrophicus]
MTPRRPVTLRRTLVIGIAGLLAAVTIVIGVLSVFALQAFLVGRLDSQLLAATDRTVGAYDPGGGDGATPPPATQLLGIPGQREGTLAAIVSGGVLYNAAVISEEGELVRVPDAQLTGLVGLPVDGIPRTVDLGDLGRYRVAVDAPRDTSETLLVGLPLAEVETTIAQLGWSIAAIGAIGVALAVGAGAITVRLALRPLERVADTAARVARLPLDRGEVALAVRVDPADADPGTEVGKVGAALNVMLDHVSSALAARQSSENKLRTFVADASHELRTPLSSIRGYAELTRRSGHTLPDDIVHSLGRVESESVRMTGLVEDLLMLARLDEGASIERHPVDLTRVVVDAVSDARAAGPDHEWVLAVPKRPISVEGDAARLHQVVANLLANARVHTPVGTTVTASLSRRSTDAGAEVVLEVRDSGPGIEPDLLPTVFERFVRGDSSRARSTGSTGLGLAIVAAIVDAHGGRTEVTSKPGVTCFRVILPA